MYFLVGGGKREFLPSPCRTQALRLRSPDSLCTVKPVGRLEVNNNWFNEQVIVKKRRSGVKPCCSGFLRRRVLSLRLRVRSFIGSDREVLLRLPKASMIEEHSADRYQWCNRPLICHWRVTHDNVLTHFQQLFLWTTSFLLRQAMFESVAYQLSATISSRFAKQAADVLFNVADTGF